jgi:predicted ArsR family transcriptional regulator
MATGFNRRFFQSTRGRIVSLLRRTSQTVNDLAESLELTDNAVRAHLTTLERDGLVQAVGTTRSSRKPNVTYGLTTEADHLFPKAYGVVLGQLLEVMGDRMSGDELDAMLRELGHRLAADHMPDGTVSGLDARAIHAVGVLSEIGGMAEIVEEAGQTGNLVIRGFSCPLREAVEARPEACAIAETLLTDLIGAPVHECCAKTGDPRCCFKVLQPTT